MIYQKRKESRSWVVGLRNTYIFYCIRNEATKRRRVRLSCTGFCLSDTKHLVFQPLTKNVHLSRLAFLLFLYSHLINLFSEILKDCILFQCSRCD